MISLLKGWGHGSRSGALDQQVELNSLLGADDIPGARMNDGPLSQSLTVARGLPLSDERARLRSDYSISQSSLRPDGHWGRDI